MLSLLTHLSWPELRHHPWRNFAALLAVTLGVALAFSVQLINQSALSEFSSAVRSAGGQPDLELRGVQGRLDENLYARVATHSQVALASPVLEISTFGIDSQGERRPLRIVGIDPLVAAALTPALLPAPAEGADRFALFAPASLFINPAARQWAGNAQTLRVQNGLQLLDTRVA